MRTFDRSGRPPWYHGQVGEQALRVLHLYPKQDYFTGAAIQLRELAWAQREQGHEVVVATRPSADWVARTREAGLAHYELPMSSEVDLRSARRLVTIIRRHRIQVVHAHKGRARTLALIAGLFVRIPALVLHRGVSFPLDAFNRLGYATRRVHAVIVVSTSIKERLVASGIPARKIHVMYPSVDTRVFHPGVDGDGVRAELGFAPDDFVVTQIGVRSWKGNDDVIDAMAQVLPKAPHARLLIVGARNPAGLQARGDGHGIRDAVRIVGYRQDIPNVLKASDCCIDASWKGLGLTGTLPEALAVGRPVLGSDLEGHPEVALPGRTGYLFTPRDPASIAEMILKLANDPVAARAMGEEGRALVLREFDTTVRARRTEALYRSLLAAPGAA
ncbi:MAG: glycosyltransferase family 4 protein [Candidatus Rokubacteria bacterium]|nr:glycosyltransferase family 4 protein [Candidatus Rokubacteria bacterium]